MPMSEIRKLFIKHCSVLETKQDFPWSLKVLSTQGKSPLSFHFAAQPENWQFQWAQWAAEERCQSSRRQGWTGKTLDQLQQWSAAAVSQEPQKQAWTVTQ